MHKPIFSLDMDGTLADSHSRWLEIARERLGIDARLEDLRIYDFWKILGLATEQECLDIFADVWEDYGAIKPLHPRIPEMVDEIRRLYRVCINTACVGDQGNVKMWLKDNGISYDLFHFCVDRNDKLKVMPEAHMDDCAELAEKFLANGSSTVLISRPWNVGLQHEVCAYRNARVAKDWEEAKDIAMSGDFLRMALAARVPRGGGGHKA